MDSESVKKMTDDELAAALAEQRQGSRRSILVQGEIARRAAVPAVTTARVAAGIAGLSLIVSIVALFK